MIPVIVQSAIQRIRKMRISGAQLPYPQDQQQDSDDGTKRKDRAGSIVITIFLIAVLVGVIFVLAS